MPTFPKYQGKVPQCLSLLNLRHYFLLIYWVYFCPTALKYYLYQADSQIYCAEPRSENLFKTWRIPAYRNVYLIFPLASLLCSLILELLVLIVISQVNQITINWLGWLQVAIIAFLIAICFFTLFWVGFGSIISISRGVVGGIVSGMSSIVPIYLVIGTFIGLKDLGIVPIGFNLIFFVFFGSSIGIGISIPLGIVVSGFVGGIIGLVTGVASGILGAVAFGLVEVVLKNEPNTLAILFASCLGLACSAAFGVALSIARSSMTVSLIAIAIGISVSIQLQSLRYGFLTWLIINLGAFRFHFYLLELSSVIFSWFIKSSHPLCWDELIIFPLPGIQKLLIRNLARDETKGLKLLATLPEYKILELIIKQWNELILPESRKVAEGELKGIIANPYIAGNPVRKELFIGRTDIMRTLQEIWDKPGQCPSVILYGHRRMGKSSILQNLEFYFDNNTIFIDCNMHLIGSVDNTGELLYLFALEIYYKFIDITDKKSLKPDENAFISSPYQSFRHFIELLERVRENKRFIIMIDEFEEIEELLEQGKLEPYLLKFWRAIFQTYHWLIVAFAGLYSLQEMTTNYWNPLFASIQLIPVSFLHPNEARQLIQNPIPVEYTSDAVDNIIYLTNGQPYLIQLIGKALVTYFNDQNYLHNRFYKDIKFTTQDVQTIIDSDELFSAGDGYFQGVWSQAQTSEPEGQLEILKQLCHHPLSIEDLANNTNFSVPKVKECLKTLIKHDVVKKSEDYYLYTVELMRCWVEKKFSRK